MTKPCTICKATKPLEDFYPNRNRSDGRASCCKSCKHAAHKLPEYRQKVNRRERVRYATDPDRSLSAKASAKLWASRNSDTVRDMKYVHHYGISLGQYEQMLSSQGGRCFVCRDLPSAKRRLSVDHCHTTGKVRALLCIRCNVGLGNLRDDPRLLRALADYVEKFQ